MRPARPDASMDLLNTVRDEAMEPEYLTTDRHRRRHGVVVGGLVLAGILFGIAGASTSRAATAGAEERADLVSRIDAAETELDSLRARSEDLSRQNEALETAVGGLDPAQSALRDHLAVQAGTSAVTGPGVRVSLSDGPDDVAGGEVVDADLRVVVNGLWHAGAEAVSVNGYRVTGQTAIRNAGDAITVNYRSISPPYVIEAIGDADGIADAFGDTQAGSWLAGLSQHYGIAWTLTRERELDLSAATGLDVQHVQRRGE